MSVKNILILVAFLLVSYIFFGLAVDNGFWNEYDFVSLDSSLQMSEDLSQVFNSTAPFKFQPLVYSIHYLLFKRFFFDSRGYFLFNIIIHGLNSFLVYILVHSILRDRSVALLSGLLFACTVGSYGKSVMIMSGAEDLIITSLTLFTMIFYFKNELLGEGKILSFRYLLTLLFFLASMFTRSTSFAILGAFLAFNFFFKREIGKRIFRLSFVLLLIIALAALIVKTTVFNYRPPLYSKDAGLMDYTFYAGKNMINYLVRMIFPIHTSNLVTQSGPAVRFIYRFATEIRILIALTVVSYSFFGFVFGNWAIRFFIAWTYIMVLPFAFFQFPNDWLNIRHLYLVSVGFVTVISSGAIFCSRLISVHKWRRFIPLLVPLMFIILSRFIVVQLDKSYEIKAASPATAQMRETLAEKYPRVTIEDGHLELIE
ncbi:MAG: hypothetical protein JXB45_07000 [Candidatus Krumholzibacteriota bacterium]|nr:hypothetical protein [Candidatus Krumholzibacteriota bacterium]